MTDPIKAPLLIPERTKLRRRYPGRYWSLTAFTDNGETRVNAQNLGEIDTFEIEDWLKVVCTDQRTWTVCVGERRFEVKIPGNSRKGIDVFER